LALIIGGCILGLRYFYFFQFRRDVIVYVESSLELMGGYLPFGKDQLSITNSALAVYLSALTCIAAAFCFVGSKRLERLIGLVGFFVLSFCLVFTQSRSTWIATILGVILVIVLCIKYARLNIFKIALFWVFVIAGIVAFLGYGFLTEATTDRMQSILYSSSDVSLLTRFDIWRDSIGMIIYNPLGMGFRSSYNITLGITSHNIFLATGLACGIIGVISFIWLIVGWFKVMIGRMISSAASDKMIYIAAIGGMFAFLFSSFFDSFNYFFIDVSIMWLVFGITVFDAGGKEAAPSS